MPNSVESSPLSPPDLEYLRGFEVVTVLEWLASGLLADKPDDPVAYMRDALAGVAARRSGGTATTTTAAATERQMDGSECGTGNQNVDGGGSSDRGDAEPSPAWPRRTQSADRKGAARGGVCPECGTLVAADAPYGDGKGLERALGVRLSREGLPVTDPNSTEPSIVIDVAVVSAINNSSNDPAETAPEPSVSNTSPGFSGSAATRSVDNAATDGNDTRPATDDSSTGDEDAATERSSSAKSKATSKRATADVPSGKESPPGTVAGGRTAGAGLDQTPGGQRQSVIPAPPQPSTPGTAASTISSSLPRLSTPTHSHMLAHISLSDETQRRRAVSLADDACIAGARDTRNDGSEGAKSPGGAESGLFLRGETPKVAFDMGGSLCKVAVLEPNGCGGDDAARRMLLFFSDGAGFGRSNDNDDDENSNKTGAEDGDAFPGSRPRGASLHESFPALSMELPQGTLHFAKLDSREMPEALALLEREKIDLRVPLRVTGGGAWKHAALLSRALGVEPIRLDELKCLLSGLNFALTHAEGECFYFPNPGEVDSMGRCPTAPRDTSGPLFPYLLVNIGTGVSILRVDSEGQYERVSGSGLGGGTFVGLGRLLTGETSFEKLLSLASQGDSTAVDLLVRDIYGGDYEKFGLGGDTVAACFGGAGVGKGAETGGQAKKEDIARALLQMVANNLGQIAYLNAVRFKTRNIFFAGNFLRHNAISMLHLAKGIHYWSGGFSRACFLRHEGFFGALGALLEGQQSAAAHGQQQQQQQQQQSRG